MLLNTGGVENRQDIQEVQLTHGTFGHCINSTQCFSPDGDQVVYDTRNIDSGLAGNGEIRILDITTGEDRLIYKAGNQSEYGPGVGAATWSPDGKMVLFLGGIQNADKENPYSFTRRTGIGVYLDRPLVPVWMDGRDIRSPFTSGALRGGTHAHTWSGDGKWISFTYDDFILGNASKHDNTVIDTRSVGLLFPGEVVVPSADGIENKNGHMTAVLVSRVVKYPQPGSDEISRAFDECWIGSNGYSKPDNTRQERAIAFQGHIIDINGNRKTEIFVADIPSVLSIDSTTAGTEHTLPSVPAGIIQRRVTFTESGISAKPRHWLRSTPDGCIIGFMAVDKDGIVQLWGVSPNGGALRQLTHLNNSIEGPFNFSPDGSHAAFVSDGRVTVVNLADGSTSFLTPEHIEESKPIGAVVWSPDGRRVIYNRYVKGPAGRYLQVFSVEMPWL